MNSVSSVDVSLPVARLPLATVALFLDLDGTLAEFAARPQDVGPDASRTDLLRRAAEALDGRLAIISGRTVEDVDRITDSVCSFAAGVHGLERRGADGEVMRLEPHPALARAQAAFDAFATRDPGLLVEAKRLSVALHFRLAPSVSEEASAFARALAAETGLALLAGESVIELRTPGSDKGAAVRAFMDEAPFRGATPIFVGDDITDEDAFRAVEAMGGTGVLVGRFRPTAASSRLSDVAGVHQWLERGLRSGAFELGALHE